VNRCGASDSRANPAKVLAFLAALLAFITGASPAFAQAKSEIVPDVWQGDVLLPKPEMHNLERLRFVTDSDYPPFNYLDQDGQLAGFNVAMARAVCLELGAACRHVMRLLDDAPGQFLQMIEEPAVLEVGCSQ
jgi:ABC-type amino acid transport substrate-binding protein